MIPSSFFLCMLLRINTTTPSRTKYTRYIEYASLCCNAAIYSFLVILRVSSHSPSFKLGAVTLFVDFTSMYFTNSAYSPFSATTD